VAVPRATIGVTVVVAGVGRLVRGTPGTGRAARAVFSVPVLAVLAALVLLVVLPRTALFKDSYDYVARRYLVSPESTTSTLLDESEMRILDEVDRIVPEHAVVAGQPWDGSVLEYVLDLGGENFWGDDGARFAGLDGLVAAGVAEEVARVDDSRLLRVTACEGTEG